MPDHAHARPSFWSGLIDRWLYVIRITKCELATRYGQALIRIGPAPRVLFRLAAYAKRVLPLLFATPFAVSGVAAARAGELLIDNVRIADGRARPMGSPVSVLIREGRIVHIGPIGSANAPPSVRRIDGSGRFLSPGLIDTHVHMMWSPACKLRHQDAQAADWTYTCGRWLPRYLKAYVAAGVTTIVDNAVPEFVAERIYALVEGGAAAPRYLYYAPVLMTKGGYGDPPSFADGNFVAVQSVEDAIRALCRKRKSGAVGVKVMLESGFLPSQILPTHDHAILAEIGRTAHARGIPIFVHASSQQDMERAFVLAPRAFVHAPSARDRNLTQDFIAEVRRRGIFQVTTLQSMDSYLSEYEPQRLRSPLLSLLLPSEDLAFAHDIANAKQARECLAGHPRQANHRILRELLEHALGLESIRRSIATSERAIVALAHAGVSIVLGSDTPHHPFALYSFHGASSRREVALLRDSGLAPAQVLRAATLNAAFMLGIESEVGTVERGKVADLLLLREDPASNSDAYDSIEVVIRGGIAHTPAEWMQVGPDTLEQM